MPKNIGSGISSTPHSLQYNSTQNNQPATTPPIEQSSASQAVGQSAMRASHEKGKAKQMHKQFLQEKRAENKKEADKWNRELNEADRPVSLLLAVLERNYGSLLNKFNDLAGKFEGGDRNKDHKSQELEQQDYREQIKLCMKEFDELSIDFNKGSVEFSQKALLPVLERFDALSKADRDSFYGANDELKHVVNKAKENFIWCKWRTAIALKDKAHMWSGYILGEHRQLDPKYEALMHQAFSMAHSGNMHRDVEEIIADYDNLAQLSMAVAAEGIKAIENFDEVLTEPFLMEKALCQLKKDIEREATSARINTSLPNLNVMSIAKNKLHLLMNLVTLDHKKQQGNENLQRWHELAESLVTEEYAIAESVNYALMNKEVVILRSSTQSDSTLFREEVQTGLEDAREGLSQLEKAIRTCEKTIDGYEKLEGIAKDDRMTLSLQELKAAMTGFVQAREFAVQFWADKLQELKDHNDSFLPPHLQSKSLQKKADKKLASQQSDEQPEFSQRPGLYKTTECVVFGRVNEKGELHGLNKSGKVIATYFKDKDSDKWVKDYGNEFDLAQPVSTVAPTAPSKTTAVSEKINRIALEVEKIANHSLRFPQEKLVEIGAGSNYDSKFNWLDRAYSEKFQAVRKLKNLLVDLEFELKESQAPYPPGEELMVKLKAHLERWQKDKQELGRQVAQAKKELDHHNFKRRNPTGTTFETLLEQGQVASVTEEFKRRQNLNKRNDWLARHVISFAKGAQGEEYEPWIVHAHYNSNAPDAMPVRVHMKRNAEKDWGVEQQAYHSPPLRQNTFTLVKQEAHKEEASSAGASSAKKGNRRRR